MRALRTPLCSLEPQVVAHAPAMFDVLSDRAIYEFEGEPPPSMERLVEGFHRKESRVSPDGTEKWLNWVVRRTSGELIGYVQATVLPSGASYIGYEFSSKYWRQGLGSSAVSAVLDELASTYHVHTYVAVLKTVNYRSMGLLRKLGFGPSPAEMLAEFKAEKDESILLKSAIQSKTHPAAEKHMESAGKLFDVVIVGGGLAGVVALAYARRAGLEAIVLERQGGVGGLWRDLPAWQDIQISAADWTLGDLPLQGATQPHILANIEAWVERFGLADGIRLNAPVQLAREDKSGWELSTPMGAVHARHLVAATGAHNSPLIPEISRVASTVREFHSSALRDPSVLTGCDVLVVGGGASAFDLLELCFQHGARRVAWAFRGTRWFMPTRKPKPVAGSVRGFARVQASGMTVEEQSAAIGADLRSRYEKFGIAEIMPTHDFDVRHDQLIPGRAGMLEHYASIERHRATVVTIHGGTVTLSDGHRVEAELLLWGTGYSVDLSYFASPAIAPIRTLDALAARCGCIFRSLDAANLYFPGVGLDGIGSAPWSYSLMCRSIMSHIKGTARLDNEALGHRLNHFDVVDYLAPRDPSSYPPDAWRAHYRDIALNTPDEEPYPIP